MHPCAFTVFQDMDDVSPSALTASSSKTTRSHDDGHSATITKENINPLTGLTFDTQPPLKKRKPSSSSALKVKPLPSSFKPSSKSKRLLSSSSGKEKGKRRSVLGSSGSRNGVDESGTSEVEELRTALGNRRAYDFTVMPLSDVTRAYDESEGDVVRAMARTDEFTVKEYEPMNLMLTGLAEEDTEMADITSKEAAPSILATEA